MTFTYDLSETDADLLLVSKVRLELGDTVSGSGIRPGGLNLSDEEILHWLSEEDDDIDSVAGRAALALANMWASAAVSETVGSHSVNYGKISDLWAKRADGYGYGASTDVDIQTGTITYDVSSHGDDPEMTG